VFACWDASHTRAQVLFIDEVHMLDIECFAFLNRALESPLVRPLCQVETNHVLCACLSSFFFSRHARSSCSLTFSLAILAPSSFCFE
jgi:hypothetical protein